VVLLRQNASIERLALMVPAESPAPRLTELTSTARLCTICSRLRNLLMLAAVPVAVRVIGTATITAEAPNLAGGLTAMPLTVTPTAVPELCSARRKLGMSYVVGIAAAFAFFCAV